MKASINLKVSIEIDEELIEYSLKADYSVFATQLFVMNMTQPNPYCFEFKFNRMNPLNLTNENFGEIEVYSSIYRRDPQQRSRDFFKQFKLMKLATIMPNETYVSYEKYIPTKVLEP